MRETNPIKHIVFIKDLVSFTLIATVLCIERAICDFGLFLKEEKLLSEQINYEYKLIKHERTFHWFPFFTGVLWGK